MLRERDVLGRKIRHTQKHGCRLLKEELKKQDIPVDTGFCRLPKTSLWIQAPVGSPRVILIAFGGFCFSQ